MSLDNSKLYDWVKRLYEVSELDLEKSKYSKTIRMKEWSWDYINKRRFHTSPETILTHPFFTPYLEYENDGIFRNHEEKLTKYQQASKEFFMKHDISMFLTISLAKTKVSPNYGKALNLYRGIIRRLEILCSKRSHWEKSPAFDFVCVIARGTKEKIWHAHLGIIATKDFPSDLMKKLQEAIEEIRKQRGYGRTSFDLKYVYDKEGVCAYMAKHMGKKTDSMCFNLYSMFHVKTPDSTESIQETLDKIYPTLKSVIFLSREISLLLTNIKGWVEMKERGSFCIPNPINKIRTRFRKQAYKAKRLKKGCKYR